MKPQGSHAHEDRLLDFAYGELPQSEARVVEQHVQGCARCSEALDGIRGVRTSMSRLSLEPAPDAGLESLLAYAQQAARRSAAGPEPTPRWWRRLMAPALGVAALGVFGMVVLQVNRQVDLSPSKLKKEAVQEQLAAREVAAPVVAQAAPAPASPAEEATQAYAPSVRDFRATQGISSSSGMEAAKPAPRRERADWSNATAGSAGGFPPKKADLAYDKDSNAPAEPAPQDLGSKAKGNLALSTRTAKRMAPAKEEAESMQGVDALAGAPAAAENQQTAEYVSQGPALGASEAVPREAKPSMDAMEDDAPQQRQAPGRAQVASAPPPPPPAPAATAPAPMSIPATSSLGSVSRGGGMEAKKSAARSPSLGELLNQADVASRSGDRAQEVAFLRAALGAGVQGSQRLSVLARLCEAEFALGHRQNAIDICRRVMSEAPGSSEARTAQRRLELELQSSGDEPTSVTQ